MGYTITTSTGTVLRPPGVSVQTRGNDGKLIEGSTAVNTSTPAQRSGAAARDRAVAMAAKMMGQQPSAASAPTAPIEEIRQSATTEAPVQASQEANTIKEEPLSTQHAILARKEKALRAREQAIRADLNAREQAFKAEQDAFRRQQEEYKTKYVERSRIAQDPFGVLAEQNLSYDQLTDLALNAPKPEEVAQNAKFAALESELKAIKDAQEQNKKTLEDRDNQQREQAISVMRHDVESLVAADDNFEMIRMEGDVDTVIGLITETFDSKGILLTVEEAAARVEKNLVDRAIRIAQAKKIKSLMTSQESARASAQAPATSGKTLTNAMSSTKPLSLRERAILAGQGLLK